MARLKLSIHKKILIKQMWTRHELRIVWYWEMTVPPLSMLNLIPKSPLTPPGLWDAVWDQFFKTFYTCKQYYRHFILHSPILYVTSFSSISYCRNSEYYSTKVNMRIQTRAKYWTLSSKTEIIIWGCEHKTKHKLQQKGVPTTCQKGQRSRCSTWKLPSEAHNWNVICKNICAHWLKYRP